MSKPSWISSKDYPQLVDIYVKNNIDINEKHFEKIIKETSTIGFKVENEECDIVCSVFYKLTPKAIYVFELIIDPSYCEDDYDELIVEFLLSKLSDRRSIITINVLEQYIKLQNTLKNLNFKSRYKNEVILFSLDKNPPQLAEFSAEDKEHALQNFLKKKASNEEF